MNSIAGATWLKATETQAVIAALEAVRPGGSRFVGGCVRNTLIGAPVDDIDIATQLKPEETARAASAAGIAAIPTGVEHGTLTLVCNHKPFEVTTLRRDVTTDGRRATVAFTEQWEEDAGRRDFRLNALYADPHGVVHDPTGMGVEDARAGRIVFIGDPEQRLREDYLRILRFFRFNAWYGRGGFDSEGFEACAALSGEIANLSAERIWKELKKTLAAFDPRASLDGLVRSGAWRVAAPEATGVDRLSRLIDLGLEHMLADDAMTRLAAATPDSSAALALSQRLKLSTEETNRLKRAVGREPRIVSYMSLKELRRALYALGAETFLDRARLAWAEDDNPRAATQWRALLALAQGWSAPVLPLSGAEVMAAGVPMGPKVGAVMREVEAWWIDADFPDDKLSIVERLKAVAQALG